jgi:organic hydroperoxide reductase OsmC/OhrA
MQTLPHHYTVTAVGSPSDDIELRADRLPTLRTATPAEFDGPGDRWSPETLLVAAIGDCLALTFRGLAWRSGLAWTSFECDVTGTLDRVAQTTYFTSFEIRARLHLPEGADLERARLVLDKAERNCLIANSLTATVRLIPDIQIMPAHVGEPSAA